MSTLVPRGQGFGGPLDVCYFPKDLERRFSLWSQEQRLERLIITLKRAFDHLVPYLDDTQRSATMKTEVCTRYLSIWGSRKEPTGGSEHNDGLWNPITASLQS